MAAVDPTWRVADIVTAHPECATVFVEHEIDFCLRGDRHLEAACAERGVDVCVVLGSLKRCIARGIGSVPDARSLSTTELISYIVSRHHAYLYAAFPFIDGLVGEVVSEDGAREPRLLELRDAFRRLASTLRAHLYEEEAVLFPALRAERQDSSVIAAERASMRQEHGAVGALLTAVHVLGVDCTARAGASSQYRALLRELAALETNTLRHIHLETHVLMARFEAHPRSRQSRG